MDKAVVNMQTGEVAIVQMSAAEVAALPQVTLTRLSKYDLVSRLTDAELDGLTAEFSSAGSRTNFAWNSIMVLDVNDPNYAGIKDVIVAVLGETRAATVLAPTG